MHQSQFIQLLKTSPRHGQNMPGGPTQAQIQAAQQQLAAAQAQVNEMDKMLEGLGAAVDQRGAYFRTQISNFFSNAVNDLVKQFTFLEERNNSLHISLGQTTNQAADLGEALDKMSENLSVGGDTARKLAVNLNGIATGLINASKLTTDFGEKMLAAQSYMENQIGVTAEAAAGYQLYAAGLGRTAAEQLLAQDGLAKKIETSTKLTGVQRDLTETIGKLAADVQIQYGRIPGSLEIAILKSRALGMSMADLNKTGQTLLNIESSIGNELEYQLLTGRRLVDEVSGESLTNAYQMATLQGNGTKQAEIMNQILQQEGETLETNMLARQQMSKLLGIEESQLARSLQKKKLLKQLDAENIMELSGPEYEQAMEELEKKHKGTAKQKLFEDLLKATDTRTTAERTADATEKMATALIGDSAKSIKDTAAAFNTVAIDSLTRSFKGLIDGPIGTTFTNAAGTFETLGNVLSGLVTDFKSLLTQGRVELRGAGLRQQAAASNTTTANDAIIQFNPRDKFMTIGNTMLASTDVGQLNKAAETLTTPAASSVTIDANDMMKMAQVIASAIKNMPLNVSIEGQLGAESSLNNGRFA